MDRREPFRDIQGEMNRLFDSFFGRPLATATGTESRVWMPVVDMYETKDDLILNFELPGVREKEVSLSITGDLLTVRGERQFNQQLNTTTTITWSAPTGSSSAPSSCQCTCRRGE